MKLRPLNIAPKYLFFIFFIIWATVSSWFSNGLSEILSPVERTFEWSLKNTDTIVQNLSDDEKRIYYTMAIDSIEQRIDAFTRVKAYLTTSQLWKNGTSDTWDTPGGSWISQLPISADLACRLDFYNKGTQDYTLATSNNSGLQLQLGFSKYAGIMNSFKINNQELNGSVSFAGASDQITFFVYGITGNGIRNPKLIFNQASGNSGGPDWGQWSYTQTFQTQGNSLIPTQRVPFYSDNSGVPGLDWKGNTPCENPGETLSYSTQIGYGAPTVSAETVDFGDKQMIRVTKNYTLQPNENYTMTERVENTNPQFSAVNASYYNFASIKDKDFKIFKFNSPTEISQATQGIIGQEVTSEVLTQIRQSPYTALQTKYTGFSYQDDADGKRIAVIFDTAKGGHIRYDLSQQGQSFETIAFIIGSNTSNEASTTRLEKNQEYVFWNQIYVTHLN